MMTAHVALILVCAVPRSRRRGHELLALGARPERGSCFNKHDLTVVFKVVTVLVLSGRSGSSHMRRHYNR
jgi:hypothetical protein